MGSKVTEEDLAIADTMLAQRSGHVDNIWRYVEGLESFMWENEFEASYSRAKILYVFAAQWVRKKLSPVTIENVTATLSKYRVDPHNLDDIRERLTEEAWRNGLKRFARAHGPTFTRRLSQDPLPHISPERPECPREQEHQAFWALLCVTGNRPDNVYRARALIATSDFVEVSWGVRKVNDNVAIIYEFSWTARPPAWIVERWNRIPQDPWWPSSQPHNIASRVNSWLKRHGSPLSSSSPRERLDRFLRRRVEAGRMNETLYTRVIDHKYATGLDNYARGVWVM